MTRIVAISDTHRMHDRISVPDGDILVHAGDFCGHGDLREVMPFLAWLEAQPHPHKVLIAGNHDVCFQSCADEVSHMLALMNTITYLQDAATTIAGLNFYGSPWQPEFFNWAFNLPRGNPLAQMWARIPAFTNVLVTHGPPHGMLDMTSRGDRAGCEELAKAVDRVAPKLHIFGHIHEGYGVGQLGETVCVNASVCTVAYRPVNAPVVIDVDGDSVKVVTT